MTLVVNPRLTICLILLGLALAACGQSTRSELERGELAAAAGASWPASLPLDALQPWEQGGPPLSASGRAGGAGLRSASALGESAEFAAGVERFSEGGDVLDQGEASRLQSGSAGSGELSFALYRLPLNGAQPGALAFDVNLRARSDGSSSAYYVGLSDYAKGGWEWHGPYSDHHVRLARTASAGPDVFAGSNYLSPLGNLFVTLVAFDGNSFDVLGISAEAADSADTTAPPAPAGLSATPVAGGLALQWNDVIAGDLAGYRIYHSNTSFTDPQAPGVLSASYVEGTTRFMLAPLAGTQHVRISAIDASGNESALSNEVSAAPLAGSAPALLVEIAAPSFLRDEPATLSVSSATAGLSFDYDLDGDGDFELTGQSGTSQSVDTSAPGLIRPRVRASSGDGLFQALGGVSLFVVSNSRPVASALATPQSGTAPLQVDFDGAESLDFDGTIVGGGWDFDGDGTYDAFDDTDLVHVLAEQHIYNAPGLYNAKLRVIDSQGAWDVDTVSVFVADIPGNLPPEIFHIEASPSLCAPNTQIDFSADALDQDGTVANYAWDFDNDGTDDATGQNVQHSFAAVGVYNVRLKVTDNDGAKDRDYVVVMVQNDPPNQSPVAFLSVNDPITFSGKDGTANPVTLEAAASYDPEGGSLLYAFDPEGDGSHGSFGASSSSTINYTSPGLYQATVYVQDAAGNEDSCSVQVEVRRITPRILEIARMMNGTTAIAALTDALSARVGIAYYDTNNDDLRFAVSTDQAGTNWMQSYIVDPNGAEWISMVQGSSQFNIAFYRDGDLFWRASQNDGQSFNVSGTVDSTVDDAGNFCSAVIVNGNPGVAYYNVTQTALMYNRATTSSGSTWANAPITVDNTADMGQYSSLIMAGGNPAMAYYNASLGNLRYARASDANGATWGTFVDVDTNADDVGKFLTMANIADADGVTRPAIAYFNDTTNEILYVRATDAQGTAWSSPVTVGGQDVTALSLVQASGHAFIFGGSTATQAFFTRSVDAEGTNWNSIKEIEGNQAGHLLSASVTSSGLPIAAYYDTALELHVAQASLE